MTVTGWNNGNPNRRSGAGYGIRISPKDRKSHFNRTWDSVTIEFPNGGQVNVSVSVSFWGCCPELRKAEIGRWMVNQDLAPWTYQRPPRMILDPLGGRRFLLHT